MRGPLAGGVLACLVAGLATCTVPSLGSLEKTRKRACSPSHACTIGYACVADLCEALERCAAGASRPCGSTVGDCRAGTEECVGGYWGACTGQVGPRPERCDGQDNDCDGFPDQSEPFQLSNPEVPSRAGVAVPLAGLGVLALYEEGDHVVGRFVTSNNVVSDRIWPTLASENATTSSNPALASDGDLIVGAWVEETAGVRRVMLATLDSTGRSLLSSGGSAVAVTVFTPTTTITDLAVAVDVQAGVIAVAVVEGGRLTLWRYSTSLPSAPLSVSGMLASVERIGLAPAGNGAFWAVRSEQGGRSVPCIVTDGGVACGAPLVRSPLVIRGVPSGAGATAISYAPQAIDGGWQLFSSRCVPTDGGSADAGVDCAPALPISGLTSEAAFEFLTATSPSPLDERHLLVSVGTLGGIPELGYALLSPSPTRLTSASLGPGVRPSVVSLDAREAAVVFDTDEARLQTGATAGVLVRRFCLPAP